MTPVTALDLLLLAMLAVAAYSGYRRGFLMQLVTYAGLGVGLVVGMVLAPVVGRWANDPAEQAGLVLGTILVLGGLGNAIGWTVGRPLRAKAQETSLRRADAIGGSAMSATASLLVIWLLAQSLIAGPSPTLSREIKGSAVVRTLDAVLPPPPSLVREARRFLTSIGFPDVFAGLPPAPVGRVPGATAADVRAAVAAAGDSTVQVIGQACDRIQEGSGFVVASGYVVTNAHVVAGDVETHLELPERLPATVVAFDPDLDLAVLRVEGLDAGSLDLVGEELGRGTTGAVLGFPGGGAFDAEPAAVRRPLTATGHDIYGKGAVTRDVYELQTLVRPGNSGGPFVLPNGHVAGVVFAASSTDDAVGYAIESADVAPIVEDAVGRTTAVSTGPCTD
jgi:S1-C subfamily serine protease